MKKLISLLVVAVVLIQVQMLYAQTASLNTAVAAADEWLLLGTRTVDYTIDRDVISLKEKGKFEALKLVVKNGTLNMHKCTVHFTDGGTKEIELSDEINKANDGIIMDLKGSNRLIEKVTFWYDSKNSSDNKSIVEVWGKS